MIFKQEDLRRWRGKEGERMSVGNARERKKFYSIKNKLIQAEAKTNKKENAVGSCLQRVNCVTRVVE